MAAFVPADPDLRRLLESTRTIAIVGLSDNPARPSNPVGRYLMASGYTVVPVNPTVDSVFGLKSYPSLAAVKEAGIQVDMVDVFRNPAEVVPVAKEAVEIGARSIWFQLGVVNDEAAKIAQQGGLTVVMDRCTKIEHARLVR